MSDTWKIRLGENILVTQKEGIESNFVRLIHNEYVPLSAKIETHN